METPNLDGLYHLLISSGCCSPQVSPGRVCRGERLCLEEEYGPGGEAEWLLNPWVDDKGIILPNLLGLQSSKNEECL